jgi:hypothetical protein
MMAGRQAGKKLKISAEKIELHTPYPIFKPFSPSGIFRGMGGLPKISTYLKKNNYICL